MRAAGSSQGLPAIFCFPHTLRVPHPIERMARVLLTILLFGTFCSAQEFGASPHEFSFWTGGSFASGHVFGFAQDRRLYLANARYGRSFANFKSIRLRYTAEITPVAVLSEPYEAGVPTLGAGTSREYIYGGGFSPIGLQVNFCDGKRLQPVLDSNGGALWFTRKVLSPDASRFNFTVHMGLGLQTFIAKRHAVTFGYRYHHLSNANITDRNPGTDSHMVFISFSLLR